MQGSQKYRITNLNISALYAETFRKGNEMIL